MWSLHGRVNLLFGMSVPEILDDPRLKGCDTPVNLAFWSLAPECFEIFICVCWYGWLCIYKESEGVFGELLMFYVGYSQN